MGFIGKQPAKAAITSSDITDGIVTADKLASNAVTTAKINADAVTDAKIADDVVGSEHLTAGEVDTTALGADAVTAAKIADDAISDEHLDATAITGQTAETSVADDDLVLISDTSASAALKKMTVSNLVANAGGGKINQVLHTDAQVNQNVSSDTELMSLAITPSASNSKIYMLFNGTAQMNANEYCSFDFYRGSLSSGTKILDGGETLFNGNDNVRVGFSMSMLDSPNTTSQVTYTVVGVPLASGTIQFGATARNTLTLMEVLA